MILSRSSFLQLLQDESLTIEPFKPELLNPCSYTLRLGDAFRRWTDGAEIDVSASDWNRSGPLGSVERANELVVRSGDFLLGASIEKLRLPLDVLGILSTTSHMARFGLSFIQSSSLVRPGYGAAAPSQITFEMSSINPRPVSIPAGTPVCHLVLARVDTKATDNPPERAVSVYEGEPAPAPPNAAAEWAQLANYSSWNSS